jgi:glycosyltransferase involved in cell wall biosynthesis
VLAPSFPGESASDGQSIYVLEATRALAAHYGRPLEVISLKLEGQPARERMPFADVRRVPPVTPIADPFRLYDPPFFEAVMHDFARAAAHMVPRGSAPIWAHGYELGPAVELLGRRGHPIVTVLHYSLAQESWHYLRAAADPLRRPFMPPLLSAVGRAMRGPLRAGFVRASSRYARAGAMLPWPELVRHQLRKMAMERMVMAGAHRVVAVSQGFAESLARFYPWARPRIVHCLAGAPAVHAPRSGPRRALRLLAVGRPTPQKGWDHLAEALHVLEQRHPDVAARIELAAVGGAQDWVGAHTELGRHVRERFEGLRRIRFVDHGRKSRAEVARLYGDSDVLVLPSDYEPFGLVLVEAMAAGLPVLASDADGPRDVIRPDCGWIVPFRDARGRPEALARAIVHVASLSHDALARAGEAAQRRAAELRWTDCARAHAGFIADARAEATSNR